MTTPTHETNVRVLTSGPLKEYAFDDHPGSTARQVGMIPSIIEQVRQKPPVVTTFAKPPAK